MCATDVADLQHGEEVTLMNWGNAIAQRTGGNSVWLKLNLDGDYKTTKKKLFWIPHSPYENK